MNQNYVSVHFKADEQKAAMITAFLLDAGYEGVEESNDGYIVSVKEDDFNREDLDAVMKLNDTAYTLQTVAQQNWNAAWESSFDPVLVDSFAVIRASFHAPVAGVQHDIIITPKMSFGTGHHATTYLMIEQMQHIDFSGKTVIDFGTGTGVLAILAEKLGAASVVATDNDEWSIHNSEENIAANACTHIRLLLADNWPEELEPANIILANINLNVILANLQAIRDAALPGAIVLFSGLMTGDEAQISTALEATGFHIIKILHNNGWICLYTTC
ncbi:MAG: 50S ribosomal protein L11 methyltransferase [Ferruginibacter sp.]